MVVSPPVGATSSRAELQRANLLSLSQGFASSAILFALMRLGVLSSTGRVTAAGLAEKFAADPERIGRLLDAGVMLGVLESAGDETYEITSVNHDMLADRSSPAYLGDWLDFMSMWYIPFGSLDRIAAAPQGIDMYSDAAGAVRRNTMAMHNFAASRGLELLDHLEMSNGCNILDVGCGPGTYSFEIGRRFPGVALTLADRPQVLEVARDVMKEYTLSNSVTFLPVDLAVDRISGEYDLVLVSNTLQAFAPEVARELVASLFGNVRDGGSIVIQAQFLDADRRGPRWATLVDVACLAFTPAGRNHTVAETQVWLEAAGFSDIEHHPMSLFNTNGFVSAKRVRKNRND